MVIKMHKGFIFSIDALFAAVIVILLSAILFYVQNSSLNAESSVALMHAEVYDGSIMALYQQKSPGDYNLKEHPSFSQRLLMCKENFIFENKLVWKKFCKEVQ